MRGSSGRSDDLTGESAGVARTRSQVALVATTDSTVLLTGETGTGKGVVARAIHRQSKRRGGPFIHVDCPTLAASVIESELFGHERGAFTGAVNLRVGRFERAGHGTIFLDEIGELDVAFQAKLLRVLQDREFERVGGSKSQRMMARVIAATNRDLRQAVSDAAFRADLLFRLSVFEIRLPSLRERREDIPALADELIRQVAHQTGVPAPSCNETFLERLRAYPWPGNVRELMNVIERLVIENPGGALTGAELEEILACGRAWSLAQVSMGAPSQGPGPPGDRDRLAAALISERGNVSRAARRLGLPRSTLRYRLRQHGL